MAKRTSRDEQAERTRAHILRTALDLFSERGFRGTSTKRIAEAAGVSEGLIFHHFPRKRDLLAGVAKTRGVLAQQAVELLRNADEVPASSLVPMMAKRFVAGLLADTTEARLLRVLVAEWRTDPELRTLVEETAATVTKALVRYFEARAAAGELRSDLRFSAAARSLLGAFMWFLMTEKTPMDSAEAEAYAQGVVDTWMRGARVELAR